jgi:hypothetical protein
MRCIPPVAIQEILMSSCNKFWPWDDNPEGEIYDNLAWDLPGFRPSKRDAAKPPAPARSVRKPITRK